MSDVLKGVAARYAAGLRAASSLSPVSDARRLEVLRAAMRYGIRANHFACEFQHGWVTWDDWDRFVGPQSGGPSHDLGEFTARDLVEGYVRTCMAWLFPDLPREQSGVWAGKRLTLPALDDVVRLFPSLPDACHYLR